LWNLLASAVEQDRREQQQQLELGDGCSLVLVQQSAEEKNQRQRTEARREATFGDRKAAPCHASFLKERIDQSIACKKIHRKEGR